MLENPLILICLAISCGALIGGISVKNVSLGVAGVLFAGIIWGYIEPAVKPPDALATFGLALFVYAIGLSSSDFLFETLTSGGWRYLLIPPVAIGVGAVVAICLAPLLNIPSSTAAGIFAGALTNTPSLAAATTALGQKGTEATLGYAFAYPLGVLIPIVVLSFPLRQEKHETGAKLTSIAIRIARVLEPGESIAGLLERHSLQVRFARCIREGKQFAISGNSVIRNGDIVTVVGLSGDLRAAAEKLGTEYDGNVLNDHSQLDVRRIFASSPEVCGKSLRQIGIFRNYEGIVTRVRRGDRDFIPNAETVIMPGDRLRVVAPRENLARISEFIGDSYQEASEFNILSFGLGLAMGIAIGTVDISLPGIGTFEIGPVAGCLIIGLLLGVLGRTGPLTWYLPYSTSIALRQLGLVIFLACAGIKAGGLLHSAPLNLTAIMLGACITAVACLVSLAMARLIAGKSWPFISGILAGVQTQPAVLGFAAGRCGNEQVEAGYAETYPLSMLVKIIFVQLLLLFMQ